MDINSFVEDIVKAEQKLSELKAYEEHRANDDITEAVLICHPKVTNSLKRAIHENNLKDIPIISTSLAEKDKIYMVTDKEFIKNARMMMEQEERKEKDCNNCANATEDFNDEVDTGCYLCCKGLENNYAPIE